MGRRNRVERVLAVAIVAKIAGACGDSGAAHGGSGDTATGAASASDGTASHGTTGTTEAPPVLSECGGDTGDTLVPAAPEGCTQQYLVGADDEPDLERPAGLYTCPGGTWPTVHRSEAVTCLPGPDAECLRDCDCGPGRACLCRSTTSSQANRCIAADCAGDEDCPGEHQCLGSRPASCGISEFRCTTDADECASAADCLGQCSWNEVEEFWSCSEIVVCE